MRDNNNLFKHYTSEKNEREIRYEMRIKYGVAPEDITYEMVRGLKNAPLKKLYLEWRRKKYEFNK